VIPFLLEIFYIKLQKHLLFGSYVKNSRKTNCVYVTVLHQLFTFKADIVDKSEYDGGPYYGNKIVSRNTDIHMIPVIITSNRLLKKA
jgi:hypothetical protein